MTEELDAILFDAGGTLFGLKPPREEVFGRVLRRHGFRPDEGLLAGSMARAQRALDEEFSEVEGDDERGYWGKYYAIVLDGIGFSGDVKEMSRLLAEEQREVTTRVESWEDFPETKPVLKGLRGRDFKLGVVSNATDLATRVIDNLELTAYFDFVLISSKVGVKKPSAEIFHLAARRAGTSPNRAMYIGDRLATDVKGARRAGMNAVLVDRIGAYPDCGCVRVRDLNFLRAYF